MAINPSQGVICCLLMVYVNKFANFIVDKHMKNTESYITAMRSASFGK